MFSQVRRWAIATARSLGRVDRDNYYDLQEVFSCMFYIIDLGITVDFPNVDESYCSGKLQMLPPHLYDSKNKKNYWLGMLFFLFFFFFAFSLSSKWCYSTISVSALCWLLPLMNAGAMTGYTWFATVS